VVSDRTRLLPGETLSLRAVALDADGDTVSGQPVTWTSEAPAALAIGMDGALEALAEGAATITATVDGISGARDFTARPLALVDIAAGRHQTCGLEADGQAWCWGEVGGAGFGSFEEYDPEYRAFPRPAGGTLRFLQLSLAAWGGCGVTTAGAVSCWGANHFGQLGDGSTVSRDDPQPVSGLGPATAVATERDRACARLGSGEMWCWGGNGVGQLGDGTYTDRPSPVRAIDLAGVTELALGGGHSCALAAGGQAWCWGDDRGRQVGIDTAYSSDVPVATAGGNAFTELRSDDAGSCGVLAGGGVRCWGWSRWQPTEVTGLPELATVSPNDDTNCGLTPDGEAWCWGLNRNGGMGRGSAEWDDGDPAPVLTNLRFTRISSGYRHACALTAEGEAWCWGIRGSTGDGSSEDRLAPVAVATAERFIAIEAGLYHTCALTAAGAAWCWGSNFYGETGTGTTGEPQLTPAPVVGGHGFVALAVGYDQVSCGITASGEAWCWGRHPLGVAGVSDSNTPVLVAGGHAFASLSVGDHSACGVTTDGEALCWEAPSNTWYGAEPEPAAPGEAFQAITVGDHHFCGLTLGGEAKCWGSNDLGQIGNGVRPFQPAPKPVVNGSGLAGLSAGDAITYGLDAAGRAIGWPRGVGVVGGADVFPGTTFTHLVRRSSHGCGVRTDGVTVCWGRHDEGQLGNGTTDWAETPVEVIGGHDFARLALGYNHTCGLTTEGEAWCWGWNADGQLGSTHPRTETAVPVPARVLGQ
jgi:alpha-tubulin suppressor-like RCC1 family protein